MSLRSHSEGRDAWPAISIAAADDIAGPDLLECLHILARWVIRAEQSHHLNAADDQSSQVAASPRPCGGFPRDNPLYVPTHSANMSLSDMELHDSDEEHAA